MERSNNTDTAQNTIAAAAAARKVLGTAELLEMILLQMPFMTLLRLQRVCHEWGTAIQDSSRLQQALFKMPVASSEAVPVGECNLRVRWITTDRNRQFVARETRLLTPNNPEAGASQFYGYELHPRFYVIIKMWLARVKQAEPYAREKDVYWRFVLLFQPLLTQAHAWWSWQVLDREGRKSSLVTLGDFHDVISGTSRNLSDSWRERKAWICRFTCGKQR
ncbi:hypothetical protein LTR95_016554 [Oleoguttula sp. CCFEE 5521]